jgi:hypothetical protein
MYGCEVMFMCSRIFHSRYFRHHRQGGAASGLCKPGDLGRARLAQAHGVCPQPREGLRPRRRAPSLRAHVREGAGRWRGAEAQLESRPAAEGKERGDASAARAAAGGGVRSGADLARPRAVVPSSRPSSTARPRCDGRGGGGRMGPWHCVVV